MPVAVNCFVIPLVMLGFAGVTAMDTSAELVTLSVVVPEIVPDRAVMTGEPTPAPLAIPALVIVAMALSDELQITWFDRS